MDEARGVADELITAPFDTVLEVILAGLDMSLEAATPAEALVAHAIRHRVKRAQVILREVPGVDAL